MTLLTHRAAIASTATAVLLSVSLFAGASAQVATLADPDADAESTPAPVAEGLEGQEAMLQFAACMRDNGIDMDDPQFGVSGGRFGFGPGGTGAPAFDPESSEFQGAMEACGSYLEAMRPQLDAEEEAERADDQLAMAECMRAKDYDFPDPEPGGGFGRRVLDSGIDFTDADFQEDLTDCQAELGIDVPAGPGAPPSA